MRTVLFLSMMLATGALAKGGRQHSENTTTTVLTTIFEGDTDQSESFLTSLNQSYSSFLNHWVSEGFCTDSPWGDEAARGCRRAHAMEQQAIIGGSWTTGFKLSRAEFNRYFGDKNVGTYNFTHEVEILPKYGCKFTLQITAILNVPDTPVNHEFFAECEDRR